MRYSLGTLLFVMLCVGGTLTGFRVGYYGGVERRRNDTHYSRVYSLADCIVVDSTSKQADFDSVIAAVKSSVDPASWSDVGGPASVQVMAQEPPMLVILQTGKNHDAITNLFSELRKVRQKPPSKS